MGDTGRTATNMDGSTKDLDGRWSSPGDRPTTAVRVTQHPSGKINPNPTSIDEAEFLIEEYLSPRKLKALTGVDDLDDVRYLEMKVDASETSLGNFGSLLPNLSQLKLNNSIIFSVRDLGSSFNSLGVLWMSRCNLDDLDGVCAMNNLKELYLSYNEIHDLSPLSMMESLEILDLEGNNVSDITQVEFLSLIKSLKNLTLEGNPICVTANPESTTHGYDYRSSVIKLIPQIDLLDDITTAGSTEEHHAAMFDADWNFLKELESSGTIVSLDSLDNEEEVSIPVEVSSPLRPTTGYRPGTSLRPTSAMKRLQTGRIGTAAPVRPKTSSNVRPASSDSGTYTEQSTDASDLTTGAVFCGNPSKVLRMRRSPGNRPAQRIQKPAAAQPLQEMAQPPHDKADMWKQSKTEEGEESENLFKELEQWHLHHRSIQDRLKESRAPNVLKIEHDEEEISEPVARDDEDQGFVSRQDSQPSDEEGDDSPSHVGSSVDSALSTPKTFAQHETMHNKFSRSHSEETTSIMPQIKPPISPKDKDNLRRIQRLRRRTAGSTTIVESPIITQADSMQNHRELASFLVKPPVPK